VILVKNGSHTFRGWQDGAKRLLLLLAAGAAAAGLYLFVPWVRDYLRHALRSAGSPLELQAFVLSYPAVAPLTIFLLTLLQAVIAIMPLCLVMAASTLVFGLAKGVLISLVSQVIAGYLVMRLTKYFGRPFVERWVPARKLLPLNRLIEEHEAWGVLLARLMPLGSFDLVNFAAGLLNVRDRDFVLGTLIGAFPATLFYGIIGAHLLNPGSFGAAALLALISLVLFFAVVAVWVKRQSPLGLKNGRET
jgi:uncharacterized membrane protein YdjX (TVP38/TMEM64 family)